MLQRSESLYPCSALLKWTKNTNKNHWWSSYCSSGYFIDYDEESNLSYLALMYGELLGHQYRLEKHPKEE